MEKKKILHFITGLGIGGTETMLLRILPMLQNNFDNRVCALFGDGPIGIELRKAGIQTYHLNLSATNLFNSVFTFRKIIMEFKPNILVTYLIHADLFGRIFGRIFGIKNIICSQRGSLLQWEFLRLIDRLTKFLVKKYIVQTEVAKKELMKSLKIKEGEIVIIPNAINSKEFNLDINRKEKLKELDVLNENSNIVCVSNLRRGKGHEYLLDAFEKVFHQNKTVNLLIVGDGEQKQRLVGQTRDYKSKNNIYFLGNRKDVKEILKTSDIFILPTLAEGMSNAIMEAMAAQLAIITTSIPTNIELLGLDCGLLVSPASTDDISNAILRLLSNETLKTIIAQNAKKRIDANYSLDTATEKLKILYEKFI